MKIRLKLKRFKTCGCNAISRSNQNNIKILTCQKASKTAKQNSQRHMMMHFKNVGNSGDASKSWEQQSKLLWQIYCTPNCTYFTVGNSLTLAVMSTASNSFFSTSCSNSHNSFLCDPKSPFLGFSPCLSTCSKTMKKCWSGMWSESSWWPKRRLESRTSLMTSFKMLTKLLFSICTGSRSGTVKRGLLIKTA